jgi:multidrug efflux system membrane fusion protein
MTWRRRLTTICLPLLLLLALVAGCKEEQVEQAAPVVRPVKMLTIEGQAGAELSYPGRVAAANQVDLSFRVSGPLISLPIHEGQAVARGSLLASIDPRDYEIGLDSATARYEKVQADFDRMVALYERDAVSKAQLDQTRAARDMAVAAREDAEAALKDTRLRAPFGGLVGETFVENYQDVRASEKILSLIAVDEIKIEVDLPESIVAQLREGEMEKVRITALFESAPGREFELQMNELAAQADSRTQTYRATLRMRQPEGVNILPGMTATVFGRVEEGFLADLALTIPSAAVVPGPDGDAQVWVVDTDTMTVHRRAVTTGSLAGSDRIAITDGLKPGETIATSAVTRLREGMQVARWEP